MCLCWAYVEACCNPLPQSICFAIFRCASALPVSTLFTSWDLIAATCSGQQERMRECIENEWKRMRALLLQGTNLFVA